MKEWIKTLLIVLVALVLYDVVIKRYLPVGSLEEQLEIE
jgi:hypothetical protein